MSDEPSSGERVESAQEHHEEAQRRERDERPPGQREERGDTQDPADEGLLGGMPGSAAIRPTG